MTALYALPSWLVLVLAVVLFVGLACAGLAAVRGAFPRVDFSRHNPVVGIFSSVVASLFTVTVAFVVAIVWQEFDGTSQRIAIEAASAKDLWHVCAGLPEPLRHDVRRNLAAYARAMVDEEWPAMRHGGESPRAEALVTSTFEEVARFRPADAGSATAQSTALGYIAALHDTRHHRLNDNSEGLAPFEWAVLLLGAVAVLSFTYLVGLPNMRSQYVMTSVVAAAMAAMFVLIFELDYPFRSDIAVPADLWRDFAATRHAALPLPVVTLRRA